MKLNKGLFRDSSLEEQPVGTWVGGKDWIYSNKYTEIINEPGFANSGFVASGQIIGIVKTPNEYIVFQIIDTEEDENNEIGIVRNGQYSKILVANLLFNANFPIFGESYYNFNSELICIFSDAHNSPKIINIDNLPFSIYPSTKKLINKDDIYKLDMFSSFKVPVYKLKNVNEANGNLLSGVYYLTIQYQLPDENYGNFLHISNPIPIIAESSNNDFNLIYACPSNTTTSKSISILIQNLDTNYNKLRFGIIHKSGNNINCYLTDSKNISNSIQSFTLSSTVGLESTTLENILIKSSYYKKIKAMTNIDNVLYIANLETETELKYQKYANNIQLEYVYEDEVGIDKFKGSHKDPVILFDKKSFMPGEIYAFYIRFNYKGGYKTTQAFHIPGRPPVAADLDEGTDNAKVVYKNAKRFHMGDTILPARQSLGYWENANEKYPEADGILDKDNEYDGSVDYEGNIIEDGIDLTGKKVRHHKFPTTNFLSRIHTFLDSTSEDSVALGYLINPIAYATEQYRKDLRFSSTNIPYDYLSEYNTKFTNITDNSIDITLTTYSLTGNFIAYYQGTPTSGYCTLQIITSDGITETVVRTVTINSNASNIISIYDSNSNTITLPSGHSVKVVLFARSNGITDDYSIVGEFGGGGVIIDYPNEEVINESNLSGKILGIKLKNIYIPDYIKDQCESFEVLYAERTAEDMTVLSQGLLGTYYDEEGTAKVDNYYRFYGFDLLSTKKQFKANYLIHDLDFTKQTYLNRGIGLLYDTIAYSDPVFPITKNNYVKNDMTYVNLGGYLDEEVGKYNQWREEHINIEYNQDLIDQTYHLKLATLYSFNPNVYTNYSNKNLVRTGKIIQIGALDENSYIEETDSIYGGDVHFNLHGVMQVWHGYTPVAGDDPPDKKTPGYIKYILYPCYTILNVGYRFKGEQLNEIFYPAFNLITNNTKLTDTLAKVSGQINGETVITPEYSYWQKLIDAFSYINAWSIEEYYPDILDYSSVNNLEPILIFDPNNNFTNKLPYRIHKSNKQFAESITQNWRIFNPAEYYESVSNKGEIIQLETDGNDLIILHKYSLFVARNVTTLNVSESVVTALGNSNIFDTKPIEIVYDKSGYVGCSSKWAVISFKYGILIIDRYRKKIFIYSNLKVEDISSLGMEEFFKNNLQYNKDILNTYTYYFDDGEVIQFEDGEPVEYAEATTDQMLWVDNPFTQFGYHAVWDDEYSRIIISKIYNDDSVSNPDSFTISYYPEVKQWGWFHSYKPSYSFSNREGIYFIINNLIYKGNDNTIFNNYGNGYTAPYIDIVFNQPFNVDKLYQFISWLTKVTINNKEYKLLTFTKLRAFNYTRDSGDINLLQDFLSDDPSIRLTSGNWKFNYLRDSLSKIPEVEAINLNNIDILVTNSKVFSTEWYENNMFIDNHIVIRLTFDLISNLNDYLKYVKYVLGEGGQILDYPLLQQIFNLSDNISDNIVNNEIKLNFKILDISANFNLITR